MSEQITLILVTAPDLETAKEISNHVVEQRLAACVNIIPGISSIYQWQGKIEESNECLLVLKTRASLYSELEKEIIASHPYDTPEIVALTPSAVVEKYLNWVNKETEARLRQ